jgi:lipase chaperone LimK
MKWMEEGDVVRLTLETGNTVRVLRLSREEAQREWDKFVKDNPEVARGRIGYPLKPKRKV